ncbi:hypothetical protein LINPERHAP1_LOCUS15920 [Linum perenne]
MLPIRPPLLAVQPRKFGESREAPRIGTRWIIIFFPGEMKGRRTEVLIYYCTLFNYDLIILFLAFGIFGGVKCNKSGS